ncbi:MAG: RagB/SusD family nutrient uptake outer membrane protein, partial [Tannerella sp.]|nr:RagB/SusD family nutrient uptake outer membrane protein [Tannerella sp.]
YRIYFTFQDAGFAEESMASATDEAMFVHGRNFRVTNAGAITETNLGYIGQTQSGHQWQRLYQQIRSCNDFIENIDAATFDNRDKNQLKGEAYFLRAYFYHRLTRAFGGVPLVLNITALDDDPESFQVPRSTYTECIDQVLSDLDQAATNLQDRTFANTQQGRATLAAVKALRTRVLLDAASDWRDEPTISSKVSIFASYANKDLWCYTKGSREDRWNAVKAACKDLMDNPLGHAIPTFGGDGLSVIDKGQAYWAHFNPENTSSQDHIFSRYFIFTKNESGTEMRYNGPNGYRAWGGNTPTQNLVDAYWMADGTTFDWNNPAHAAAPYANREPRFYASILFDGAPWILRPAEYRETDPNNKVQTGWYQLNPSSQDLWPGLDTRFNGDAETWNGSFTGYYFKKFMNPRDGDHRNRSNHTFPFIRMTEVYFNYIEACIGLNQLDEAVTYLNQYRHNVGLPDVSAAAASSQAELHKVFRNEKRLEFLYEEHRYWDVRRWLTGATEPGFNSLYGINVTGMLKPGVSAQPRYEPDETRWTLTYVVNDLSGEESRNFPEKLYFHPFHRDEMNRNQALIQNPGY